MTRARVDLSGLPYRDALRILSHYRRARRLEWSRSMARRDCQYLVTSWTARNAITVARLEAAARP